jgi:pyridoxamine 5'-phosphate oxidase
MDSEDLARLRRAHEAAGLDESVLPAEPLVLVQEWLINATEAGLPEPNAMALATVGTNGMPSVRLVLCKGVDERGIVFYTNYKSRKARDLDTNPSASLAFPWHPIGRQVRVEGRAQRVTDAESDAYFASRPRGAQLSAWASKQSDVVPSRDVLEARVAELDAMYPGDVPRPPHWGGFLVVPSRVEFWQSRPDRLHDRLIYHRAGGGWSVVRLQP